MSLATVPLLTSEGTTGTLGFIKFGDREWQHDEINALQAVAALLAQLQARVAAEERLRYLAYHDELTALATRRGLTDHLAERLQPGAPGPVGGDLHRRRPVEGAEQLPRARRRATSSCRPSRSG